SPPALRRADPCPAVAAGPDRGPQVGTVPPGHRDSGCHRMTPWFEWRGLDRSSLWGANTQSSPPTCVFSGSISRGRAEDEHVQVVGHGFLYAFNLYPVGIDMRGKAPGHRPG